MFCPMIIGIAHPKLTAPVLHSACKMPTDADELWMIAVRIRPASIPSSGFVNMVSRCVNCGTSFNGSTAELIAFIPNISTANPSKMLPTSLCLSFFDDIIRSRPMIARIGENEVGFSIWIKKLLLWIPERLRIHDVIVVPTLAPIMIPTA